MIAFVSGQVVSYGADWVIVDNHGMGWYINFPHTANLRLHQEVQIYTYMHISENDVALYGFESMEERDLFLRLISVKGLGPRTALNMLSKTTAGRLIMTIEQGDVAYLKSMPGIGNKTASQIILDLKGKLVQHQEEDKQVSDEIRDAIEALKTFGYKQNEINQAVKIIREQPGLTSDAYLKLALQFLAKKVG